MSLHISGIHVQAKNDMLHMTSVHIARDYQIEDFLFLLFPSVVLERLKHQNQANNLTWATASMPPGRRKRQAAGSEPTGVLIKLKKNKADIAHSNDTMPNFPVKPTIRLSYSLAPGYQLALESSLP